jgi:TatD DNase family protein
LDNINGRNRTESQQHLAVVDAHCHIDLYADPATVVAQVEALRIHTIAVTNAPSVFPSTRNLTAKCMYVHAAAGLHPELVHSHAHELDELWPFLEHTRFVGEVGLDYVTNDSQNRARQREVFGAIVERCATLGNKILTVHSRRSAADVIATVGPGFRGKAILHWFSGTVRQLERAAAGDFFFSVNLAMMLSKNGRGLAAAMPRDRVLTETDGPFVKMGHGPATPPDTGAVIAALAELWKVDPVHARSAVSENFRALTA